MTKILLLNIPSGPAPTDFPPVASLRVIEGIDPKLNTTATFINLDYDRLSFEQLKVEIAKFSADIIGISAILTPAYKYVKELSIFLKANFPGAVQVLGGEMAVIANILLHKTKIDFCVIGEAQPTFSQLIAQLQRVGFDLGDKGPFKEIKEIAFMLDGNAHFTGYDQAKRPELLQMNYELLKKFTNIDQYMQSVDGQFYRGRINKNHIQKFFSGFLPGNVAKKMVSIFASQGCVGTCTYCHRYFKGYQTIEPEHVIKSIEELDARYGAGLIQFLEENFGSDKAATKPILACLARKKLNWMASSVRAKTITEETIREWKASGCVHLGFGIESCSAKILKVMEKRMTVEDNLNAIRLCAKYDIFSMIGLVIGMPGETEETIQETIDALSTALPETVGGPYEISPQWFQAIPGTPGYEFARLAGRIGPSLDDEEQYILGLYEINANDMRHYLNFTDYAKEDIAYWKDYIFLELMAAYIRKHGLLNVLKASKAPRFRYAAIYMLLPRFLRRRLLKYFAIIRYFSLGALFRFLLVGQFAKREDRFSKIDESLRVLLRTQALPPREDDKSTYPLRSSMLV